MLLFAWMLFISFFALVVGYAMGYKEGREEAQLRILKMRRAINANRQG
jgi:uncharacterized membrane protein